MHQQICPPSPYALFSSPSKHRRYLALSAAITLGVTAPIWAQDNWLPTAGGSYQWNNAANWSSGVPNNFLAQAVISNAFSGEEDIQVEGQTVSSLVIGTEATTNEPVLLPDADNDPLTLESRFGGGAIFVSSKIASNNAIANPLIGCDLNLLNNNLLIQSYSQAANPDPSNPNYDAVSISGALDNVENLTVNHATAFIEGAVNNFSGSIILEGGYAGLSFRGGNFQMPAAAVNMMDQTDSLDITGTTQTIPSVSGSGTIYLSQADLQVTGNSTFSGNLVSFFSGQLDVQSGTFSFGALSDNSAYFGLLEADPGATLAVYNGASLGEGSVLLTGGTLESKASFQSDTSIALAYNDSTINTDSGTTLTQSGVIRGNAAISKNGTGTLILANPDNSYVGLTINEGTVATGSAASSPATTPLGIGPVTLSGGTLALQAGSASFPLNAVGFNQDVVVENTATNIQQAVTIAFDSTNNTSGFAFYENGYQGHNTGLPQNPSFVSATNGAVSFTLQPYTSNNVLLISGNGGQGTLQLSHPGSFNTVSFLAAAANGIASTQVQLNFTDGSDAIFSEAVPDWFTAIPAALSINGRLNLIDGSFDNEGSGFPQLYDFDLTLPAGDTNKTLLSVNFTDTSGGLLGIFALSGNATNPNAMQTYDNDVDVTSDSTISVTGSPVAQMGNLTIGSNTLFVTGNPNAQLQFVNSFIEGNAIFDVAANTQLVLNGFLGAGGITKNNTGLLTVVEPDYTGSIAVNAGKMIVEGNLQNVDVAIAAAGTLQISNGSGLQYFTSLNIATGGLLDLGNNLLILSYAPGTQAAIDATIRGYLVSGYAHGGWNGPGIDSSAIVNHSYGLGYADGADGVVAGLVSGQIEVSYTLYGDANLDGVVSGDDFTILTGNLGKQVTGWDKGDFNYDGVVNGDDFTLLIDNLGKQASGANITLPAADYAAIDAFAAANGLMADVPEPASASILAISFITMFARQRRRILPT